MSFHLDTATLGPLLVAQLPTTARLLAVDATSLAPDGSYNADLWRVALTWQPADSPLPAQLIAKLPSRNAALLDHAAVFQPGARENWFYTHAAQATPIATPRCYYHAIDAASGQSILLLQDLGPTAHAATFDLTLTEAQAALGTAARLHAAWWEAQTHPAIERLRQLLEPTLPDEQNFVGALFDAAWSRFKARFAAVLTPAAAALGDALVGHMPLVDQLLEARHATLVHGDFRRANLAFANQQCWVFDWEDLFFGNGLLDVSWLLGSGLPPALVPQEVSLVRAYHAQLVAHGVSAYPWTHCWEDYRRTMFNLFVQGVLSAVHEAADRADLAGRVCAAAARLDLLALLDTDP
jgi:hypothetical protein